MLNRIIIAVAVAVAGIMSGAPYLCAVAVIVVAVGCRSAYRLDV